MTYISLQPHMTTLHESNISSVVKLNTQVINHQSSLSICLLHLSLFAYVWYGGNPKLTETNQVTLL